MRVSLNHNHDRRLLSNPFQSYNSHLSAHSPTVYGLQWWPGLTTDMEHNFLSLSKWSEDEKRGLHVPTIQQVELPMEHELLICTKHSHQVLHLKGV